MFLSIRYKLQSLFSSGWSRWVDKDFVYSFDFKGYYVLKLIQVKVNSKNGKKKFRNVTVAKSIYSSEIQRYFNEISK